MIIVFIMLVAVIPADASAEDGAAAYAAPVRQSIGTEWGADAVSR
jgi:hypothetical protein